MRRILLLCALSCFVYVAFAANGSLDGLDAFVATTLKDWDVPGVAIAVVQDGKVILAKGYGFRDVKKQLPVTPKTLFAIGSATKSFTVTDLGILVDKGKLNWDRPVREYLPDFRLYDQFATERMTPRDLVTHRSGLPRHDFVWYNSSATRRELFERLRYLEPSKDFRTTFQYQNLMFMTAGYLAGQVADRPWEDLTRESIFMPLGMTASNFSVAELQKANDFSLPYRKEKEVVKEIPFRNIDTIGPAGSINSNVEDMSRYLLMHMNKGKSDGKQILSEANDTMMQTPQMVIPGGLRWKELGYTSYGMGLFITSYRGHALVHHGGNIDGFTALVTFMPQDNIGMVILSNMNGSPMPTVLSYNVYDRLLGLDQVGWTARLKEDEKKGKEAEEMAKKQGFTARKPNTHPSHELKDYAANYENPGYGIAKVTLDGDRLKLSYNGLSTPLNHFHYDIFEVPDDDSIEFPRTKISFQTNLQGDVASFSIPLETTVKEIVFTRAADTSVMNRATLEPLAGHYELGPAGITVALQGETALTLTIQGQPALELIPTGGLKFTVKGLTGYSVEFKLPDQLVFYQPNGTFVAKRTK
ncbi:MAG TPA: serine hydrolase [Bryobacteraceae bacterium]|nr:serine hydrolase [Bryobacteraceae bacterium]